MNIHTNPDSLDEPKVKRWTEQDDALAREMRAAGYSWPLINEALGGNARKRLERTKLTPEQKEARRLADRARIDAGNGSGINITWTDEQVEQLKKLYDEGLSYSLIAPQIGTSRSACIAKVRRLKLPPRIVTQTMPRAERPSRPRVNRTKLLFVRANGNSNRLRMIDGIETEIEPLRTVQIECRNITFDELSARDCRYINGDPLADGRFCGLPQRDGSSYCHGHHGLVWLPANKPKKPYYERARQ